MDCKLLYKDHLRSAISKANRKIGLVMRTLTCRKVGFLHTLWSSLVQPHMDYASVLWCPVNCKGDKVKGEEPLRNITRKATNVRNLSYWKRLEEFKLSSNGRRMERYKLIYILKSLHGKVPSLGFEWMETDSRNGPNLKMPRIIRNNYSLKAL